MRTPIARLEALSSLQLATCRTCTLCNCTLLLKMFISRQTTCCFQSTNEPHHYYGATSAPQPLQLRNRHKFIRHNCVAGRTRRSSSTIIWSLHAQKDDNNIPSRKRRRRAEDVGTSDEDTDISDTVTSLLFKPFSIPFSLSSNKTPRQTIPTIYPLALVASFAVLPPITSILVVVFFGIYLALLLPLLDEYDDISLDKNDEQQDSDGMLAAAPVATSFLGAVASAAILSPEDMRVLSLNSVPYLLAVLMVGLGGYVLFTGVNDTAKDTREWEIEEMDSIPERKERYVMKQWDDELKEKEDELN